MLKLKKKLFSTFAATTLILLFFGFSLNTFAINDITQEKVSAEEYQFSGSKNCGDDDGFTEPSDIKKDDNHYGWKIGNFIVSGYTRVENGDTENPIFLKNVGDTVKLSFILNQDINKLNGDDKLKINDDEKAYDEYFGIKETNFGKGALIIKYTNYENKSEEPQIYTDYLSGIEVGANTEVQLCEEGDYEVSLDYSVLTETFGDLWKIKTSKLVTFEDDYKIFFKFSVRNGNCMAYPFDVKTGQELTDTTFTENGFRLDLAKSRYLKIDITKQVLNAGKDGLTEDTRFNKPARDGEEFTEEGIYTITVSNTYTNRTTEKIIYVGSDSVLQAYVTNQSYSVAEINDLVTEGATINDDGTIDIPDTAEIPTEVSTEEYTEITTNITEIETTHTTTDIEEDSAEEISKNNGYIVPAIIGGAAVVVLSILIIFMRRRKRG
ncbi:MAG: hypothetical protein ACI4JM_08835 [Oscillospiraceae bacterium]